MTCNFLSAQLNILVQEDPRPSRFTTKRFVSGEAVKTQNRAYVIIAWASAPKDSKITGYQISGNKSIMNKDTLEETLAMLVKNSPADIYVIGNNWGAGTELSKALRRISKDNNVDVYIGSSTAFESTNFVSESEERIKEIQEAIEKITSKK